MLLKIFVGVGGRWHVTQNIMARHLWYTCHNLVPVMKISSRDGVWLEAPYILFNYNYSLWVTSWVQRTCSTHQFWDLMAAAMHSTFSCYVLIFLGWGRGSVYSVNPTTCQVVYCTVYKTGWATFFLLLFSISIEYWALNIFGMSPKAPLLEGCGGRYVEIKWVSFINLFSFFRKEQFNPLFQFFS